MRHRRTRRRRTPKCTTFTKALSTEPASEKVVMGSKRPRRNDTKMLSGTLGTSSRMMSKSMGQGDLRRRLASAATSRITREQGRKTTTAGELMSHEKRCVWWEMW
jgi:hypothetical protein